MVSDPNDLASDLEEAQRQQAIALARMAPAEEPDEDDAHRYCLDCGEIIPPARVAAVQAVRCVSCAQRRELRKKQGLLSATPVADE